MLRHAYFSMRDVFKLQPFINVCAFVITCLEKACLLLPRAKRRTAKGLAFSRRVINKAISSDKRVACLKTSLMLKYCMSKIHHHCLLVQIFVTVVKVAASYNGATYVDCQLHPHETGQIFIGQANSGEIVSCKYQHLNNGLK